MKQPTRKTRTLLAVAGWALAAIGIGGLFLAIGQLNALPAARSGGASR